MKYNNVVTLHYETILAGVSMIKKYLFIIGLITYANNLAVTPYYYARTQSFNTAREIVGAGWNSQINLCNMDIWYGNFEIVPEYTHSFKPEKISNCLFGSFAQCYNPCRPCYDQCKLSGSKNSCCFLYEAPPQLSGQAFRPICSCCTMPCCNSCCKDSCCFLTVSGSHVENRGRHDLLADYFGLPTDYKSVVCFKPEISNFIVECDFCLGLDEWVPGLYLKFRAPICRTRWDLNMCECIVEDGINNHQPGYFNNALLGSSPNYYGIQRMHLTPSFTSFITGCGFINVDDIRFLPLHYARMNCTDLTETSLADLRMILGWNFACNRHYNIGFSLESAAPTGNRPEGVYLFEPIVGNGKHWEVGCGLHSFYDFYVSDNECSCASIYVDATITHFFKTKQVRTFDLCGKPLSRYMPVAKFGSPVDDLKAGNVASLEAPKKQFLGIYEPLANLTTFSVDVGIGVQADITCMLQYIHSNFSCDVGYSFWGRTCEDINFRCDCPCQFESDTWGLKGDAFMYGFKEALDGTISSTAVALSATQSCATICKGTNNPPNGFNNRAWAQNPGIDNSLPAWDGSDAQLLQHDFTQSTTVQAYTSLEPKFISICDINSVRAGTKGMSHKFFAHLDYRWDAVDCWVPYVGLGGEVEFGHNSGCADNSCDNHCSINNDPCSGCSLPCNYYDEACRCCNYCSLSQWGLWIKGGIAFH